MRIDKIIFVAFLFVLFAGCEYYGGTGTGGISLTVVIPSDGRFYPSALSSTIVQRGVVEVSVIKGDWAVHRSFDYTDYSGVVTGIPAGDGYTVKVLAKFVNVYYGGVISNVVVLPGIVNDLGRVYLKEIPSTVSTEREKPPVPVVTYPPMYQSFMTRDTIITIYGTKATGTAIVVNSNERIPPDDSTTWSVTVTLNKNQWNHFEIKSKIYFEDKTALESDPVYVTILHDSLPPSPAAVDFTGGGVDRTVAKLIPGEDPLSSVDNSRAGVIGVAVFRGDQCPTIVQGNHYKVGLTYDGATFVGYYPSYFTDSGLSPSSLYDYCLYTVDGAYNYSNLTGASIQTAGKLDLSLSGTVVASDSYFLNLSGTDLGKLDYDGNEVASYTGILDAAASEGAYALVTTNSIQVRSGNDNSLLYSVAVTRTIYGVSVTGTDYPYLAYSSGSSVVVVDVTAGSIVSTLQASSGGEFWHPYMKGVWVAMEDSSSGKITLWNYSTGEIITPDLGFSGVMMDPVVAVDTAGNFYIGFRGDGVVGYAKLDPDFNLLRWKVFPGVDFDLDGDNFYLGDGVSLSLVPLGSDSFPLVFASGKDFDVSVSQQRLIWIGSGYVGYR